MSENGLFGGMGDADDEDGGSLFSAFKPAPKPRPAAPLPAPAQGMGGRLPQSAAFSAPAPQAPAPAPVPPPLAPRQPAPPDMSNYFQQKINDLERRLLETQEKALMFSLELKNREELQRRSVNQAEELFEKLNQNQKNSAQEQKMRERLEQLEGICRRLESGTAGAAGAAGAAAAEIGPLKMSLEVLTARVAELGAGAQDMAQIKAAVDNLNAKMTAANIAAAELAPLKSLVNGALERFFAFESKLSALESKYGELSVKNELTHKIAAREDDLTRERVERLERNSVPMEYVDRCLSGFEMDSQSIRKMEGMTDSFARRMAKLEGVSEALQAEQVKVNEFVARESTILEELRAKFASMSAIFEHLRKLIIK